MPSPSTAKLPIPKSPDEFEDICLDVLKLRWGDPHAARNGRNGQSQQGIDIYSEATRRGAQCKNKETLSHSEILSEVQSSKTFRIPLVELTFLVAGPRDTNLQRVIESVSGQEQGQGGPVVRILFWDDIASDISRSPELIRKYWGAFLGVGPAMQAEDIEQFRRRQFGGMDDFGRYYDPDWHVLRDSPTGAICPFDFMRLRIYAPGLQRADFEPDEEDQFAAVIGQVFEEAPPAVVPEDGTQVIVESGGPGAGYHRRWAWSSRGCMGVVTTLRDLHTPSHFSVPDVTWDLESLLGLAGAVIKVGKCFVVLDLHVFDLLPKWSPSDLRVDAEVGGIRSQAIPCPENRRSKQLSALVMVDAMCRTPHEVATELMVPSLRDLFKVRLSKDEFAASLPRLRQSLRLAQKR
jgi:hypothetical protein